MSRPISWCLDLLFPRVCLGCQTEGSFFCRACRSELVFSAPHCLVCSKRNFTAVLCGACERQSGLRRFLTPFSYRTPAIRDLIHAYKFDGARELASFFADMIAAFCEFYGIRPPASAILVPIPIHRHRERQRGFNQSALLADELARRLRLVVAPALRRPRWNTPQTEMESYAARRKNVAGAFTIADAAAIRDRTVILVDDVAASGATLSEAARILRTHGAHTVWAVTIAKS